MAQIYFNNTKSKSRLFSFLVSEKQQCGKQTFTWSFTDFCKAIRIASSSSSSWNLSQQLLLRRGGEVLGDTRFTTSEYDMPEESIIDRRNYTNLKRNTRRTTRSSLFFPGSSVEKVNNLSFTILCTVTMTPDKYRYERAAAVGKNSNLGERTDREIGTWESEKSVLCKKSLALTFKKSLYFKFLYL